MANTIPDIRMTRSGYLNVYSATGIPQGSPVLIQNKSTTGVYVQVRPTQPPANSTDGYLLMPNDVCIEDGDDISIVWVIGAGALSVQVLN